MQLNLISDRMRPSSTSIWERLPKPFTVLAPMEDVTDTVFRRLIIGIGRPDLFYTEFTSSEGLRSEHGREKVHHRLEFDPVEHPIIAQIWGKDPEAYAFGSKYAIDLGFDGIDINMGCAVKKVIKQGCCSALMKDRGLATEIIRATQENSSGKPVSVKTRLGFSKIETEDWISFLLEYNLSALAIHGRSVIQQSKGVANWDEIAKAVKIRDSIAPQTLIIGNGDVSTREQLLTYPAKYGVDGIMIGRGIFQDPWIFSDQGPDDVQRSDELLRLGLQHIRSFGEYWEERKNADILKRFMKIYVRDIPGGSLLRDKLLHSKDLHEMERTLQDHIS